MKHKMSDDVGLRPHFEFCLAFSGQLGHVVIVVFRVIVLLSS